MHVLIDAFGCNPRFINDPDMVAGYLDAWVEAMGMKKLDDPRVYDVTNDEPGVTGLVVITESHLSVHTFTKSNVAWVDLFSCKDFETKELVRLVVKDLGCELVEYQVVDRGFGVGRDSRARWWQSGPPSLEVAGVEAVPAAPQVPSEDLEFPEPAAPVAQGRTQLPVSDVPLDPRE